MGEGHGAQLEGRFTAGVLRHTVGQPWLITVEGTLVLLAQKDDGVGGQICWWPPSLHPARLPY